MKRKRILILGAAGMLGHITFQYLSKSASNDVVGTVFSKKINHNDIICDVRDLIRLKEVISEIRPDVVINCIGALIRESRKDVANTIFLNAYFPHALFQICNDFSAKLIHISTDCVFSGKNGPYAEDAFKDADDIYGRSKALGELDAKNAATIRTSIIGPELKLEGEGLFHWFANQTGIINGYTSAYWGGITTLECAKAIEKILESELDGLFQVTNGEAISKFELLSLMKEIWCRADLEIVSDGKYKVNKSLNKSVKFNFEIPTFKAMLVELKDWMDQNPVYTYR